MLIISQSGRFVKIFHKNAPNGEPLGAFLGVIRFLFCLGWRDIAPLRLAEISSGSPSEPIKKHCRSSAFLLAEMERFRLAASRRRTSQT
jgi:hypothetical protein